MLLSVGELKYWGATTTYGKGIVPVTEGATSGPLPQLGRSLGRLITSPFVSLSSKNAPRTWEAPPKLSAPPWRNCSPVLPKAMKTIQVQRLLALAASLPPPQGGQRVVTASPVISPHGFGPRKEPQTCRDKPVLLLRTICRSLQSIPKDECSMGLVSRGERLSLPSNLSAEVNGCISCWQPPRCPLATGRNQSRSSPDPAFSPSPWDGQCQPGGC